MERVEFRILCYYSQINYETDKKLALMSSFVFSLHILFP
jgi:hypothetical protein